MLMVTSFLSCVVPALGGRVCIPAPRVCPGLSDLLNRWDVLDVTSWDSWGSARRTSWIPPDWEIWKQNLTAQKSHPHGCRASCVHDQHRSLLQWRGPHKVVLVRSLWRRATTDVSSVPSKGEEEEEAVSQRVRKPGSIMGEIEWQSTHREEVSSKGDKRCGSRIFCLPAWPFLKSLLLMTHTQWRAYTWGLASPAQNQFSHQHPGSITGVQKLGEGLMHSAGQCRNYVQPWACLTPRAPVPIMLPPWLQYWGLPSGLTSGPFTPLGFLAGTGILWLHVEIIASLVILPPVITLLCFSLIGSHLPSYLSLLHLSFCLLLFVSVNRIIWASLVA